jgi:DNA-binding NtrC family response regulator
MQTKILFADADDSVRKMVTRVLQSSGYVVIATADAAEAAAVIDRTKPDLLLLDLPVPSTEGWAPLESLHRADPSAPVIVTTAWPIQKKPLVPVGIAAVMEKPLDLSMLLQTIAHLIETRVPVEWKTTGFDCEVRKASGEEDAAAVHVPEIAY